MIGNIIGALVLVALVVLFGWLTKRAWGTKRWFIKWPGVILAGLLTLLLALIAGLSIKGVWQFYMPYPALPVNITVNSTPETIARGKHIASMMCANCHTMNGELPLSGGNELFADSGLPLGQAYPPNITPGGKLKELTDNDIYRILKTGIEPGGRLTVMVAVDTRHLSEEDTRAVIAYLRSAPAVEGQKPPVSMSFMSMIFAGAGLLPLNVPSKIETVSAPPQAATKEYGEYIVSFMDCRGCHGPTLSADGGMLAPPGASNLTVFMPQWTKDDFFKAMRTGIDKTGHQIQAPMPWKTVGLLEDDELEGLYLYLHSLTPILTQSK